MGDQVHALKHLTMFLMGQFISYEYVVRGAMSNAAPMIVNLIVEVYLLGWPEQWIAHCLRLIPQRFSSPFIRHVRLLGRVCAKYGVYLFLTSICPATLYINNPIAVHSVRYAVGETFKSIVESRVAILPRSIASPPVASPF